MPEEQMAAHPTTPQSKADFTIALIVGLLLPDFLRESPTTPPHIAKGFAIVTTASMVIWWAWWLSKRERRDRPPTSAIGASVLAATTAGIAASLAQWHWFAEVTTQPLTWSALLLSVAFGPLATEALLRAYLQPRLEGHMSSRDLVFTCAAAGAVVGGSLENAFANALISAVLTFLVLHTGLLILAPTIHCTIALISVLATRTTPLPANRPVAAIALSILALGATWVVVKAMTGKSTSAESTT